jgi:hypothetical protein
MRLIVLLCFAFLAGACATRHGGKPPKDIAQYLRTTPYPRGVTNATNAADFDAIARDNRAAARFYLARESDLYPSLQARPEDDWPRGLPRTCVAFSGGGLRSAAVSIGVLQALAEKQRSGDFGPIDVLSGVSGGAYAISWLYAEGANHKISFDQLLLGATGTNGELSPAVAELDKHASTVGQSWLEIGLQGIGAGLVWAGGQLMRLIPQPEDDLRLAGGVSSYYNSMLRNSFNVSDYKIFAKDYKLACMEGHISGAAGRYPVPVIGAAARIGTSRACSDTGEEGEHATSLWRYFEFSPLRVGSSITGYRPPVDEVLADIVTASGAAPEIPAHRVCGALAAFGMLTGAKYRRFRAANADQLVNTPALKRNDGQWIENFDRPTKLYISDGGFAENLAVFPLVQRHCQQILSIDATYDPFLTFDDFQRLQHNLNTFHGIALKVPRVVELTDKTNAALPDWDVDGTPFQPIEPREECKQRNSGCIYADGLANPVFAGVIRSVANDASELPFDWGDDPAAGAPRKSIRPTITLVKLSLDRAQITKYLKAVQQAYKPQADGSHVCKKGPCFFPQAKTTDQRYRRGQFESYRSLGYDLISLHWNEIAAGLAGIEHDASQN